MDGGDVGRLGEGEGGGNFLYLFFLSPPLESFLIVG
jgi:hypothetical protein